MIKIEVTGSSIPEVADKLLAIGYSLRNTAINDADNAAREEMQVKRKTSKKLDAVMPELREEIVFVPDVVVGPAPEAAEMAAAPEPVTAAAETASSQNTTATAAETASSQNTTATAQQGTTESSETSTSTAASSASSAELDFDKDVAPHVLMLVKEKGKPAAQEILSQFGVERASLLDRARWPELVEMLKEAL